MFINSRNENICIQYMHQLSISNSGLSVGVDVVVVVVIVIVVHPNPLTHIRGIPYPFSAVALEGPPSVSQQFPHQHEVYPQIQDREACIEFSAVNYIWCYVCFCFAEGQMGVCLCRYV